MLPRSIAWLLVVVAAACSAPDPRPSAALSTTPAATTLAAATPAAAIPAEGRRGSPWLEAQPQLRAWQQAQQGKNLLDGIEGLVALECIFARLYPGDYDAKARAYRQQHAARWADQFERVARELPQTTTTFFPDVRDYVLANSNLPSGPAVLAAGMPLLQMRGRLAFCDGFVATSQPDDVFLTSWTRANWVADLFKANPNGVPQDLLFLGLWEAREQWLRELETEPYDEFRDAWGHILSELLHEPVTRSNSTFQTLQKVALLRRHQQSRFREPAPFTDEFVDLLVTIQALATSDNPRTAASGADAWWNAKRGINLVWSREADPIRRVLLGAMRDECIDAGQALSPGWERVDAGVIASAKNWQQIVRIAREFDSSPGVPLQSRIRSFTQLMQRSEQLGRPYVAVLRHVAKPMQRQLEQEASDLHADGCTVLASMRWLEAQQLCEPETLRLDDPKTPFGDLRQQLIQHLPSVDRTASYYSQFQDYLATQMLGQSRLARMYGIRLRRSDSPNTDARMRLLRKQPELMRWSSHHHWAAKLNRPRVVTPPVIYSEELTKRRQVLEQAVHGTSIGAKQAEFASNLDQYDALHDNVLAELRSTCQQWIGAPTTHYIETSVSNARLPPREREARRWLLGLSAHPPQRLKPRPLHPETLAQLILDCSDAATATKWIHEQIHLRSLAATADSRTSLRHHITRLQPVWAAYLMLYGRKTMHEQLLKPLFAGNRDALRIVLDAAPVSRRELLRQQLGL
tara:strand:- start:19148 stop:21385 length:2238 start_codon:yes stop_codon:yes gene_type:complete